MQVLKRERREKHAESWCKDNSCHQLVTPRRAGSAQNVVHNECFPSSSLFLLVSSYKIQHTDPAIGLGSSRAGSSLRVPFLPVLFPNHSDKLACSFLAKAYWEPKLRVMSLNPLFLVLFCSHLFCVPQPCAALERSLRACARASSTAEGWWVRIYPQNSAMLYVLDCDE